MTKQSKSMYSGEVHAPNTENQREHSEKSSRKSKSQHSSSHSKDHQKYNREHKNNNSTHSKNNTSSTLHPRLSERYSIDAITTPKSTIVIPKDLHKEIAGNKRKTKFSKISYGIGSISVGVMFLLGFVAHQRLQSVMKTQSMTNSARANSRYVRSINNNVQSMSHSNDEHHQSIDSANNQNPNQSDGLASVLRNLNNDISLLYREYITPILGGSSNNVDNQFSHFKNSKLHFEPDSKASSAHHVLEGEGFRLNIPSYVESVPVQKDTNKDLSSSQQQNSNILDQKDQSNFIKNEKFDKDILNFDITQKKLSILAKNSQEQNSHSTFQVGNELSDNYLPKKAVISEGKDEIPLGQSDPGLVNLVRNIIQKNFEAANSNDIHDNIVNHNPKSLVSIFNQNAESTQCIPSKNMVFAKTHKTGGTTVTNMLLRHAEKHSLDVALPIEYHWELGGYPANFNKNLVTPKQKHYNLIAHHMRFNKTAVQDLLNPTSDYFTILRDPVSNFESSFGFFKDYPFTSWLDENRNINDFIDNPEKLYNKNTPWYFRAKNYMSFDLGFNHEDNSDEYITHVINEMEKDFKYVMITDRYEESMILLKNMLCLDYDDIVYLPLKVRTDNDRKMLSPEASAKIKQWNRLDTAIYEYYSQKFEQLTVLYGKEKLAKEVKILQEKLKDVEARCVEDYDSQSLKPWIKRIKLRKPSGQNCQRMVWGEVKYADYLRQLQYGRMTEEEYSEQPKLDEKIELMKEVQRTVLGDIV